MKLVKIISASFLLLFAATTVNAQTVNAKRSDRAKVKQGIRSGELTKVETASILKSEKEIRQDKKAARADGKITRRERKEIRRDKKKADAKIYRLKHNNRDRN